ncbi:hypothetical protein [Pseudomonas sp. KNUC1026]|uniref:hypothetical protein n=1 Tax=Pseudomonas sp. KNUC1026 TaxID=2893890 RepID=UPI003FA70B33
MEVVVHVFARQVRRREAAGVDGRPFAAQGLQPGEQLENRIILGQRVDRIVE